ncbi:MAG: type II toxin-antitoxin system RelE/ParE family toxin [Carboxylicivirga sp.]|jgi:hypothetical protein|nr:type II toxin-antitoxin system RelE/ParE family toxin [Carboxylicivirga sp.]
MANRIILTAYFEKRFKRLSKKFRNLNNELAELGAELEDKHDLGTHLGEGIYKIRLASKDKGSGKSGGFRIITYSVSKKVKTHYIYLITIYDKSEESSVKKSTIIKLIKDFFNR